MNHFYLDHQFIVKRWRVFIWVGRWRRYHIGENNRDSEGFGGSSGVQLPVRTSQGHTTTCRHVRIVPEFDWCFFLKEKHVLICVPRREGRVWRGRGLSMGSLPVRNTGEMGSGPASSDWLLSGTPEAKFKKHHLDNSCTYDRTGIKKPEEYIHITSNLGFWVPLIIYKKTNTTNIA